MDGQRIRIIKKNDEYSMEYQVGDIFLVDSTWYGGVNVTSKSGIPLSLDKEEYEFVNGEDTGHVIDAYSYGLGVMDCFCEMVGAGVKTLAMSHPCDSRQERNSFLKDVKKLCEKYGVYFYAEDEAFLTDLFPERLNKGKYNYLFYARKEVLDAYFELKEEQRVVIQNGGYTRQKSYEIAKKFGHLLSYTEEGTERLIQKASEDREVGEAD